MLADTYQIGVQLILVFVDAVFVFLNLFFDGFVILEQHVDRQFHCGLGQLCHFHGHTVTDFNGNCWCCQQAFVQHSMLFLGFLFLFAVPYQRIRQLFQQLGERQQHCCSDNIEDRVYQSHASWINCRADKGEVQQPVQSVEYRQNHQCADAVKADVHTCHPLGTAVYADAGEQGGDTGTDVLSHDDRDRHAVGDLSGEGECL